ncbi:MAG: anthranilate phosphoribosyltransferase [Candidatus Hydrothermarchaeota archaeon]|nr:anthranilate phosphoribosyltransferase [Candidatus Hydrothermarchaeota archaeon]
MKEFIIKLIDGEDLSTEEAEKAMKAIMGGEATQAQIGSFLTALRMKGETMKEISACARIMRDFSERITPRVRGTLVDTCGTGGDEIKTFNISTIAAFIAAGAGIPIAKHGNRSVTSKAGSADLLEVLGVRIDCPPKEVQRCIEKAGIGFMFAPIFHKAMKYAIGPRKEIGVRTVFNVLGPLTNPANAQAQILGVFNAGLTSRLAGALGSLDVEKALVVHGLDGLDEISTFGSTQITELSPEGIRTYRVKPEEFGLRRASIGDLTGGDADYNAGVTIDLLKNCVKGPKRDVVALNAAAAIYVGGKAESIGEGISLAEESIDSGKAYLKLAMLVRETGGDLSKLGE